MASGWPKGRVIVMDIIDGTIGFVRGRGRKHKSDAHQINGVLVTEWLTEDLSVSRPRAGGRADNLRGSRPIADTIEVLLRAKGQLRAIELTAALEDAAKLLPTDSASATLHKTLAEMEGSAT